ncbi:hypothetical protein T12_8257 [Trichinella patagoniensis]|uniref:Uncharacterized protein n=1 Tax=Trichinella patagoniensis TaxID=990121 RepID=A0A0V0ZM55_9BILA|nr:hypothetical protein T12_8257 [Trichinella patagoniensis]
MGNFEPFLASSDKAAAASNLPGKILRFDLEQFLSFQTAKQLKKGFSDLILHRIKWKWKKVNPGSLLVTFQSQWRRIYRSVGWLNCNIFNYQLIVVVIEVLPFYERNVVLECRRNANNSSSSLKLDLLVNNFFIDHVDQPIDFSGTLECC